MSKEEKKKNQEAIEKIKNVCAKGESDPQLNLGRVTCYHYTIGTYLSSI
jgi:hypothetical protein